MLLTNFDKRQEKLYREAVKIYGDNTLYIDKNAYWVNGHKDENLMALRTTSYKERGEFWKIFDKLKEQENI